VPDVHVLSTKIEPPRIRAGHVPRPALIEQLRRGLHDRLTLIEAAAGSGKTTLLVEWCAADRGRVPFAWLSLDAGDNDPVRFFTYVAAALRHAGVAIPPSLDAALAAPATTPIDVGLPQLVNVLAGLGEQVVLVLDDYHLIREPAIHEGMRFLLERGPPGLRVVIASRMSPPLGVARLRVRGELGELSEQALRFDRAGVGLLLNDSLGLTLGERELDVLLERTEGWAAGLYLAGLSVRARDDGAAFVASFSGEQRQLADYLLEEVLAGLSAELRDFLVRSAVLDRLSAPLCDAVLEQTGSHELLAEIERTNLFLVPLDARRAWFRYHQLFQELLRAELGRELERESIHALHGRAADWLAQHGAIGDAMRHRLAANDVAGAAELIAGSWNRLLQRGEVVSATRWLDRLPPDLVRASPQLCIARAWLSLDVGDHACAVGWLGAATAATTDEAAPLQEGGSTVASGLAMLQATLDYQSGDLERSRASAATAVRLEEDGGSPWRAVALTNLGCASYWLGDSETTRAALGAVVQIARSGSNAIAVQRSLSMLALAAADAGDTAEAERLVSAGARVSSDEHLGEYWTGALAAAAAGRLAERAGDPGRARAYLEQAVSLARRGVARPDLIYSLHALAPLRAASGDDAGARDALREASRALSACPAPGLLAHLVADAERRLRGKAAHVGPAEDPLSSRELDVLRLLPSALSLREIGDTLYVSHNTVKTHAKRIYRKLGADTRAEAVARAREQRLL
jgi:LuxR family transcriptional regulator, maltose regulon positive regulatory protein